MKKIISSILIFIFLICIAISVQAKSTVNTALMSNTYQLKDSQEIILTFKFDEYEEITKGVNAYKATLEYDENIFEQVAKSNFKTLNNWNGLEYNPATKEFVSIKKEGSTLPEELIQITLKVKDDIKIAETSIKIKDVVASEGIEDLYANGTEIKIDILREDTPTTNPEDSNSNQDNSNNNTQDTSSNNQGTNNNQATNNNQNSNNSQNNVAQTTPVNGDNLSKNPLPKAGSSYLKLFIFLAIEILIINIIVVKRKQKNLDKEISKNMKMLVTFLVVGIVSLQCFGGIYSIASTTNLKGELNDDGKIDDSDIALLELHLVHLQNLPENKLENADINSDDKITVTDLSLLFQLKDTTAEYEAEIANIETTNYYPNKNEEITLNLRVNTTEGTKVKKVLINNQEYLAKEIEGTNGIYEIKVKTSNSSGINEYHFTQIILDNDETVTVDRKFAVDVLKEKPNIEFFTVEENTTTLKANVSFYLADLDNSIISAEVKILDNSEKVIKEQKLEKGKTDIEFDIVLGGAYKAKFILNYDLDTNQLIDQVKDHAGTEEIVEEIQISKMAYKQSTSMYSWHEQTLVEDADIIYEALHDLNVDTLYQSISSSYLKKEYIEGIVEDYNEQGIEVYRLIGDPSWAYKPDSAKKKIDEINEYNRTVEESAKIKGVNLDIEPHVDDRWDEDPQAAFTQYKNTMIELYDYAKKYDLEVAICTNTWFSSYDGFEELYEKAADTYSIMNYVKSSNIKGIKEEVEIAEKYNKKLETVAHSGADSNETESYHNDGMNKLMEDHKAILETYSYDKLRASYHYFTTIEYLIDKDVYLLLKPDIVDDSGEVLDLSLYTLDGKEVKGYPMKVGSSVSYLFPGVKENISYQVKSTSHSAANSDIITIPESPKGRATLTIELKEKILADQNAYFLMADIDYTESLEDIENPERGFYYPVSIDLTPEGGDVKNLDENLVHLRVGIGAFSKAVNGEKDLEFTQEMLNTLNQNLANIKSNGGSVIIRFAYDNFDGEEDLEPSLEMILTHISQLKTIFSANKDVIAYVELGFFGPWGEMHSSDICTTDNVSKAIDEMLKATPSNMKIGVRTPEYYAAWAKIDRGALNTNITKKGTDSYRIGLYNDGYLGSESDLGTFENREVEIAWLENQAVHTLYGGEVVANRASGTPLNTIDYISKEAFRTHTTYLNSRWNDSVIASWKKEIYNGTDELYKGQSGYLYVANHLGYRFVLRKSELTNNINKNMNLKFKLDIENVGFGNLVNEKEVTIVLEKNGKMCELATNIDPTIWNSTKTTNLNFEVDLPDDIEAGEWNVYLRISQYGNLQNDDNYNCIQFANKGIWNETIGGNYIGKIQVVD